MKTTTLFAVTGILFTTYSYGQDVRPVASSKNVELDTSTPVAISAETSAILQDRAQRDRAADVRAALAIQNEQEAQRVVDDILTKARVDATLAAADARADARARIAAEEAGRTQEAREASVEFLTRRLRGEAALSDAPDSFRSRVVVEDPITGKSVVRKGQPRFYDNNTRIVTYRTMEEVPPVLIATSRLNRVKIQQIEGSPYADSLVAVERRPEAYVAPSAYAVTYTVDPDTLITRDDILFVQGSTAFADAYSYDLVVDLAYAMRDPSLANYSFIVEGHASSEGDYNDNLILSQARAERIVRELVGFGIPSSRLVPVGYGENEADYPADAAENLRATDRRVAVFRLQ